MNRFVMALAEAEQDCARPEGAGEQEQFNRPSLESAPGRAEEIPDGLEEHLVSLLSPTSFEAEQYRTLCYMLKQMHKEANLHVLAVTSPAVGDGKTTTAINLAGALAQAPEARVLLIEADLRGPSMAEYLGLGHATARSLVTALMDPSLALEDVVNRRPPFSLAVLPAGRPALDPYKLLESPRLEELLHMARQRYDYIMLDTSPLLPFPDCRLISKWIDGFLVVVAAHKTPRKLVEEALHVIPPAKIVGLVFNGDDRPVPRYFRSYGRSPKGARMRWLGRGVRSGGGF